MTAVRQLIPADVVSYLGLHHIITLSTSSFTGMPHANTVAFTSDHEQLYFYAPADSTLVRNIRDNRRVSFTVDDYTHDWRKVRELQGVGGCAAGGSAEVEEALASMRGKFGQTFLQPDGDLYVIRPFEMHFVDFDYTKVASPELARQTIQFAPLPPPNGVPVSTELGQLTFGAGDVIFRPGEGRGDYYVVTSGEVEVRAEGHGADQTVLRVRAGGMFGDQAALRGQRGQLTAHAVTATTLLTVDRDSVRELIM